jgi:hypothetical protein
MVQVEGKFAPVFIAGLALGFVFIGGVLYLHKILKNGKETLLRCPLTSPKGCK